MGHDYRSDNFVIYAHFKFVMFRSRGYANYCALHDFARRVSVGIFTILLISDVQHYKTASGRATYLKDRIFEIKYHFITLLFSTTLP